MLYSDNWIQQINVSKNRNVLKITYLAGTILALLATYKGNKKAIKSQKKHFLFS